MTVLLLLYPLRPIHPNVTTGVDIGDDEASAVAIILGRLTNLQRLVLSPTCRCCSKAAFGT